MQSQAAVPIESTVQEARIVIQRVLSAIGEDVVGQEMLRKRLMMALLTDGHILLEGVPGLAKTLSIKSFARAIDATFHRIQFTPDLLPSDIVGTEIYRPQDGSFEIRRGPVFANFLLADEVNRAPAKVQSALLETMQERQVTIGGQSLPVPKPFLVLATQNPLEQEGTYPLPEAQVDRFLFKVQVDYPSRNDERKMLDIVTKKDPVRESDRRPVASLEEIERLRSICREIYVDERVREYVVNLVLATRKPSEYKLDCGPLIELGASPRATIGLFLAARAEALMNGEHYVTPQNIKDVATDVLRHRIMPTYEAEAQGITSDALVKMILDGVPVP